MRVLLLVLVLVAGLWLILGTRPEPPVSVPGTIPTEVEDDAPGLVAEQPSLESPADREALEAGAPEDRVEGEVIYNLRVVRGEGREPVPGAVVRWIPSRFDLTVVPDEIREDLGRDREELAVRYGESTTADSLGRATLSGPAQGLTVFGRDGSWFGRIYVNAWDGTMGRILDPEPEYLLDLRADQTLAVRAIDGSGEPVPGVTMILSRTILVDGNPEEMSYRGQLPPTDEGGLTRWKHVQTVVPVGRPLQSASVAPDLVGGRGEPVAVDLLDVPEEPVDVVLPPFGSMEILVRGPDGASWPGFGSTIHVGPAGEERITYEDSVELGEGGSAVLEPVLCGQSFRLRTFVGVWLDVVQDGPQAAGERVRVVLQIAEDTPILTGRIVDVEGRPVPGAFRIELDNGRGSRASQELATNETGRFHVALGPRMETEAGTFRIKVSEGSYPGLATRTAVYERDLSIQTGINEVGDLLLGETPFLAAGRMEWLDGTPVEPPSLELEYVPEGSRPESPNRWQQHLLNPERPGGGRFEVRDHPKSDEYRLRVRVQGAAPVDPIEFRPGAEDLVIRLSRGGVVEATVLGDSEEMLRALEYRLVPDVPRESGDSLSDMYRESAETGHPWVQDTRATCRWTGLTPGAYRLTIFHPGMAPLVSLGSIEAIGGERTEDPRLHDIDLRGKLRRVTLTVLDTAGDPVPGEHDESGVLIRGEEGPEAEWHGQPLSNGRAELYLTAPLGLVVFAKGYRTQELYGVFEDTTVQLQPAGQARLRVLETGNVPEGTGVRLFATSTRPQGYEPPDARLVREDGATYGSSVDGYLGRMDQRLDPDDSGDFLLELRGGTVLDLRLELRRRVDGVWRRREVTVQPSAVDTASLAGGQVVPLTMDTESLQRALEEIGG